MGEKISRRDFLKLTGATGGGFVIGWLTRGLLNNVTSEQSLHPSPFQTRTPFPSPVVTNTVTHGYEYITPDVAGFDNFIPTEADSLGGDSYKRFLGDGNLLIDAWTVRGSIYSTWFKTETLEAVNYAPLTFRPRWSQYEQRSVGRFDAPKITQELGVEQTAIILDSGGAHSLALAYELAKEGGWQPVPMLRGIPCKPEACATGGADQNVAVALYPASEMLDITNNIKRTASPAFILDAHRAGSPYIETQVNNSYTIDVSDMPDVKFLQQQGIQKVLYVNEANSPTITPWQKENKTSDSAIILETYQNAGLDVYHFGVSPTK